MWVIAKTIRVLAWPFLSASCSVKMWTILQQASITMDHTVSLVTLSAPRGTVPLVTSSRKPLLLELLLPGILVTMTRRTQMGSMWLSL